MGQKVGFRPDSHKQEIFGKVTWIDTAVDDKTRTVKVRAEFANPPEDSPNLRLQGNMWGAGRIILREEKKSALMLPNEAIHHEGCCWVVFVQDKDFYKPDKPKVFHVRKVRLGARLNGTTEIIAGLLENEWVASKNSGILRSALLRNNLGAG
jgi:cobalt-zinc-cadmium efflux system membrane fusion protein